MSGPENSSETGAERIAAYLRPRAEQIAYLAVAALIAALAHGAGWLSGPVGWALLAALALGVFWLSRAAAAARRLKAGRLAPGVVEIIERRVGYFGPMGGGFVSLDDVERIELRAVADAPAADDLFWLLHPPPGEETLIIPNGARGAEKLLAAFEGLPGFDPTRALGAITAAGAAGVTVWRRPGALAPLGLDG